MSNSTELTPAQPLASGQLVKAALLASRDLKRTERDVMVTIAAHGNGQGDSWPSVETIAEYVGKSVRTIQRVLAHLVKLGRIVARLRSGATTVYRLTKAAIAAVAKVTTNPRQNGGQGVTDHGTRGDSQNGDVSPEVALEAGKPSKGAATRPRWWPKGRQSQNQAPTHETYRPQRAALCVRHGGRYARGAVDCRPCAVDARIGGAA
ncbi:helix-turn-helix domain-containing protein [Actinoplanes sp. NPDC048988]|uniref:helix-turn-helix domain-containing protein n=1 Tax=Actinoplanes sp. NPDC048988 TaxID=3363901 RepID=UPI003710FFCC